MEQQYGGDPVLLNKDINTTTPNSLSIFVWYFYRTSRSAHELIWIVYKKKFLPLFSLYELYPARVPGRNTTKYQDLIQIHPDMKPSQGRSSMIQGGYQFAALHVTIVIALVGGLLTGKDGRYNI